MNTSSVDKMASTPELTAANMANDDDSLSLPDEPRRRKRGVILPVSPVVSSGNPSLATPLTKGEKPITRKHLSKTVRIVTRDKMSEHTKPKSQSPMSDKTTEHHESSIQKKATDNPRLTLGHNALFDAKSEKSHRYLKSGTKAMKSSMLYQESVNNNNNNDVLQARSKLRQLQINYSKTNANLNDRVIMCDILKVTLHQVIPRIKIIQSMERRLRNQRRNRRRREQAHGHADPDVTQTIAEVEKERKERIKQKQRIRPTRKVDSLKEITVDDIEKLKSCRYLRINEKEDLNDDLKLGVLK